jgi:C4-dicarboxylate-specific signal transduction histidine kinase
MNGENSHVVLVVEDNADARSNLADILELDGYATRNASTFAEALAFDDWNLLAMILDRRLPDGTADEFLPRLRDRAPDVPIVIVTGYADLEGAIAALRQGAADYIIKPVDADSLRARMARIAEARRVKQELKHVQERLVQSERLAAIGQMMAGLAHESRNALQRSQACLEMLALEVQDRPAALNFVARIQKAQDHLHQLYEEVRDYAAPIRLRYEAHDLRTLLEETWEHLTVQHDGRDARLEFAERDERCTCRVDRFAIEQVFRNILENSLSACCDPVRITARFQLCRLSERPAIQVSLADNGPGLTAEARQRIFEPFFTTKTKGTGLGMAISRRIVEAHGGRIAIGTPERPQSDRAGSDRPHSNRHGAEIILILPHDERQGDEQQGTVS